MINELSDPDEQISAAEIETLAFDLLSELSMEGVEGSPLIRFRLVAVSFLLQNLWLVVRWAVVARPREGGRDVPTEFTFELVCGWIRDHLSGELG